MEYKQIYNYAKITYLALFDSYVVEYGGRAYQFDNGNRYIFDGEKIELHTLAECDNFCMSIDATLVDKFVIDHTLAHGLPDCRAIREGLHRFL